MIDLSRVSPRSLESDGTLLELDTGTWKVHLLRLDRLRERTFRQGRCNAGAVSVAGQGFKRLSIVVLSREMKH